MIPFDATALWAKSKVFLERGLVARDAGDFATFHTWAALALELLGKSALATVHPALVADPTHAASLFVACGQDVTDSTRSVTAKTVYERLKVLSTGFDERAAKFCILMAERRNAELHSASSPTGDLQAERWVPEFWRIAEIISTLCKRTLEDWLGADESRRARLVMADASRVLTAAIEGRVSRARESFDERFLPASPERTSIATLVENTMLPAIYRDVWRAADGHIRATCPACACRGWLFGEEIGSHRHPIEYDRELGAWQVETAYFSTEAFVCSGCTLLLNGRVELSAAGLPEEYEEDRDVEPDYEPDYGND